MKLLTMVRDGQHRPGVVIGDDVLDLVATAAIIPLASLLPPIMARLLAGGDEAIGLIARIADFAQQAPTWTSLHDAGALVPFSEVVFGPVVPDPELILSAR